MDIINTWQGKTINLNTTTVYRILQAENGGDALALYTFYCATATRQGKQPMKALDSFCRKGLHWGRDRFEAAYKTLSNLKVVEKCRKRNPDGTLKSAYILVHYLQNEAVQSQVNLLSEKPQVDLPTSGKTATNTEDKKINTEDKKLNSATSMVAGVDVNSFIPLFEEINPSWKLLFSNKTQRAALERLAKEHGESKLKTMLERLPAIVSRPYAPRVTTPLQLEQKLGELMLFAKQAQTTKGGVLDARTR